jgi:hypothetical protein
MVELVDIRKLKKALNWAVSAHQRLWMECVANAAAVVKSPHKDGEGKGALVPTNGALKE